MNRGSLQSHARLFLLAILGISATGCEAPNGEPLPALQDDPETPETTVTAPSVDTTAAAVWAHLEAANYRNAWTHWPGRDPGYAGIDPHGARLSTWLNPVAAEALSRMRADPGITGMPDGAILVKENLGAQGDSLLSVTVMLKRAGYDEAHNDWFWMKRLGDGTVEAAGRARACAECHAEAGPDWDYLRTAADQFGG